MRRFSDKQKKHVLKEIVEEIEKEKMPLDSYLLEHGGARVRSEQLVQLKEWIETIK
jgi:exonuclease VII small subunit